MFRPDPRHELWGFVLLGLAVIAVLIVAFWNYFAS